MIVGEQFRRAVEAVVSRLVAPHDWTPTVDQGGAVAATVNYARYWTVGKAVTATCRLAVTAAGTGTTTVVVGGLPLPIKYANENLTLGDGDVANAGTAYYAGLSVVPASGSSVKFMRYGAANFVGIDPDFALANGDIIGFTIAYETT